MEVGSMLEFAALKDKPEDYFDCHTLPDSANGQ